jgi:hypothetical protein
VSAQYLPDLSRRESAARKSCRQHRFARACLTLEECPALEEKQRYSSLPHRYQQSSSVLVEKTASPLIVHRLKKDSCILASFIHSDCTPSRRAKMSSAGYNKAPTNGDVGPYMNSHHSMNNSTNAATGGPSMGGANTNKKDSSSSLQSISNGFKTHCGCLECYHPGAETLDYDYTAANQNGNSGSKTQHPRIRERGEFYIDSFNDQPWSWSFGTNEMVCICIICSTACDTSVMFGMCYLYCAMCVCIGALSCHTSSALSSCCSRLTLFYF